MTEKEEARERKMVGEEGSWPGTYAAALCQAPLAEAAHAYAVLPLLLLLQPAPTPTLLHYLVKQSCRDKSGKSLGLPRLSSAGPGGMGGQAQAGQQIHILQMYILYISLLYLTIGSAMWIVTTLKL